MVICIVALVVFSVLGIFSAKWRKIAKEAFECVFRMITFRPCVSKLDERIKSKVTAKLMKKTPSLARFFYKNFKVLSWIFTIAFFASMIYTIYGIYNLIVFGTCTPGSSETCVLSKAPSLLQTLTCYEAQIVYGILTITVLAVLAIKYLLKNGKSNK